MAGPMSGWLYSHKAMRSELSALEAIARVAGAGDEASAGQIADRMAFFHEFVKGHNGGEEAVLWPALDARYPHVSTAYTLDHRADEVTFDEIEEALAEVQGASDAGVRAAAADRLTREVIALNVSMGLHSRKEDEHLARLVEESFSAEEQAQLATGMVGHLPQALMPEMVPWMVRSLPLEDRTSYIGAMMRVMPPERFRVAAGWVKQGIPAGEWDELVGRVPELASV